MGRPESTTLSTSRVREHVKDGGELRYAAFRAEDDRVFYTVRAVYVDGTEKQVVVGRSGEPKIFRSANAVVHFHEDVAPNARGVFVPFLQEQE